MERPGGRCIAVARELLPHVGDRRRAHQQHRHSHHRTPLKEGAGCGRPCMDSGNWLMPMQLPLALSIAVCTASAFSFIAPSPPRCWIHPECLTPHQYQCPRNELNCFRTPAKLAQWCTGIGMGTGKVTGGSSGQLNSTREPQTCRRRGQPWTPIATEASRLLPPLFGAFVFGLEEARARP